MIHSIGGRPLSTFIQLSEENEKVRNDCQIYAETELKRVAANNDRLARSEFLDLILRLSYVQCSFFMSSNADFQKSKLNNWAARV